MCLLNFYLYCYLSIIVQLYLIFFFYIDYLFFQIVFDTPITLLPHERKGLYCHSGLQDDLGIQYQSYGRSDSIAEDERVVLHPGLGHTVRENCYNSHAHILIKIKPLSTTTTHTHTY
jgi:hypothetical protein